MKKKILERPIGIFDSGLGGLTVIREMLRQLPNERLIYFGDTGHVPYGNKSPERITRLAFAITNFLVKQKVKLVVVACNTASAVALEWLRTSFPQTEIIGVIYPGVKAALSATQNKRIGVIGTEGTIFSRAYDTAVQGMNGKVTIYSQPCPLFVPLVEEGWLNGPVTCQIVHRYLSSLIRKKIDTLVLGCTHYPLLKPVIKKVIGSTITLIDSAESTVQEVKSVLTNRNLKLPIRTILKDRFLPVKFYVTDAPEKFIKVGRRFLGKEISVAEIIDLDKYELI